MRIKDIEIGEYYRIADTKGCEEYSSGYYGWVKVIEIFKKGQYGNPDPKKNLVKCEHTVHKNDTCGFIRYFKPSQLVKE